MNKQFKLSLLAASLVTAFAANVAYAGQIQSSSPTLAREVIETNSQIIVAPSKSYNFAGDIDARFNEQRLQVQLTLAAGEWGPGTPKDDEVIVTDGADPAKVLVYTVKTYVTSNKKTLYANITVPVGATAIINKPIITFNPGNAAVGTKNIGLTKLKTIALDTACVAPNTSMDVTFKHYTTFNSAALETGSNADSEDQRPGSVNTGRLLNFTENLKITTKASDGSLSVSNSGFQTLTGTAPAFVSATLANLGNVRIEKVGAGLDLNYTTQYGAVATPNTFGDPAATSATLIDGTIEAKSFDVAVSVPGGFAEGSTVGLFANANCTTAIGSASAAATAGALKATIKLATAVDMQKVVDAVAHVCYTVPGNKVIPQTTVSSINAILKLAPSSNDPAVDSLTNGVQEQRNQCSGTLTPIGGGVKIDVRNYVNSKDPSGWSSVIRLINPSETTKAVVFGQLIHKDGSYGGWGQLTTLEPRAVLNMTSVDIDAKLTNAPVNNGTGYVAGTTAPVQDAQGARLRISSDTVGSLRVQNYVYNTISKSFIEASSAQGVDFDSFSISNRAPTQDQTMEQDAQRGIAK